MAPKFSKTRNEFRENKGTGRIGALEKFYCKMESYYENYEVTNFSFGQNPEILPGRIWQILGVKTTKICQIRPGKFGQNSS